MVSVFSIVYKSCRRYAYSGLWTSII